ncbi:MAG: VCBS repeat-containing protein [Syntrophales bacterium]|nr:VCBS repeat-containing protein [Syntrophales bacterium]
MGKYLRLTILIFFFLSTGTIAWSKEKTIVSVLPFSVHSAENIEYVQQGIWDMLNSRVSANDNIEVTTKDTVLANLKEADKKELTADDVYGLGKKMNADFVVWGSITKIGNNVSIDGKLVDISSYKSSVGIFTQSQGLDEIIPKINDFAQRISNYITGGVSGVTMPAAAPSPVPEQSSPKAAREKAIIAGMKTGKKGTSTAIPINSDSLTPPQVLDRKNIWMSQQFGTEFKGMDIGDVNNDGLNEVVIIDSSNVTIYQKKGESLTLIQKIPGQQHDNYLSVDVADINNNGAKEIIVTNIVRDVLDSFILEWKEGKFTTIASKLPWFLRALNDSSGSPILLGQRLGTGGLYDSPIHEIIWDGTQYRENKRMKIPEGLSVYGLALDTLENRGTEKIIAFDEDDHLVIYDKTDKPLSKIHTSGGSKELLWKSNETFGGSNNYFNHYRQKSSSNDDKVKAFVNLRIISYDANKDGKKELIIVKNISATGSASKNSRTFISGEIYDLEWDGLRLAENWKTKKINGYVADYQLKDLDNDGKNEIVLALVLSVGATHQEKSVIVVY